MQWIHANKICIFNLNRFIDNVINSMVSCTRFLLTILNKILDLQMEQLSVHSSDTIFLYKQLRHPLYRYHNVYLYFFPNDTKSPFRQLNGKLTSNVKKTYAWLNMLFITWKKYDKRSNIWLIGRNQHCMCFVL